ncbi:MAG: N-acyl-D-amino-acid deacylase family protein [Bradymonadia bacterium]
MLIIKNGLVFDGSGAEGVVKHLRIEDGVLVEMSERPLDEAAASRVIDAEGCWVTPGFLDTHTHYDAEILAGPGLDESVRHGVTTVCIGSCSLSTILSSPEDCADFFSRVEALPPDQVLSALQQFKTWSTPEGYIEGLESRPLGPNVACFIGHSDMRVSVMGLSRAVDPDVRPTDDEMAQMEHLLEQALDAGYLGLSTMTNPWDKVGGERHRSARLPSTYATWGEYRRLHTILRRRERILQSAPNITTRWNVFAFFAATAGLFVRKALKVTLISAADIKASPWLSDALRVGVRWLNRLLRGNLKWQTVPMPFEVYADGMDLVVFEEFGAGEAALHLADALERNALLQDEAYRRGFRKDYEKKFTPRVWHRDFYDATVVSAPDNALVGKSFGQIGDERQIHPVDAFLDLVVAYGTRLRWKTTIANHRPDKLVKLASDANVHVSFADSGAHVRNMAFYNFALYYLRMVKDSHTAGKPVLPLGQAVRKVTGELADWYGLDAGHLRVGGRADVVVIDPDGLDATLDDYHEAPMYMLGGLSRMVRRNDAAVRATVIAGEVVYSQGKFVDGYGRDRRYGGFLRVGQTSTPEGAPVGHVEQNMIPL